MSVGPGCQPGRRTTLGSASLRGDATRDSISLELGNWKRNYRLSCAHIVYLFQGLSNL